MAILSFLTALFFITNSLQKHQILGFGNGISDEERLPKFGRITVRHKSHKRLNDKMMPILGKIGD
jgi:hypothetical protein